MKRTHTPFFFFKFNWRHESYETWYFKVFIKNGRMYGFSKKKPENKIVAVTLRWEGSLSSTWWQVLMFALALLYWSWPRALSFTSQSLSSLGDLIFFMIHDVELSSGLVAMECGMMKSLEPWNVLSQVYGPWTRKCVGTHYELTSIIAQLLHNKFHVQPHWDFWRYTPLRLTAVPVADSLQNPWLNPMSAAAPHKWWHPV